LSGAIAAALSCRQTDWRRRNLGEVSEINIYPTQVYVVSDMLICSSFFSKKHSPCLGSSTVWEFGTITAYLAASSSEAEEPDPL